MNYVISALLILLVFQLAFSQQNGTMIEINVGRSLPNYTLYEDPGNLEADGKAFFGFGVKRNIEFSNATFLRFGGELNFHWLEGVNYARYHGAFPTPNSPHVPQNKPFLVTSEFTKITGIITIPVQYGFKLQNVSAYVGPSFSGIFYENTDDITKDGAGTPMTYDTKYFAGLNIGLAYFIVPEFAISLDYYKGLNSIEFDSFDLLGKAKFSSVSIGLKLYLIDK